MAVFRHFVFFISLSLNAALAVAAPSGAEHAWSLAGEQRHSIQDLGEQFYVSVPVKSVDRAELALFDFELAKIIRLPVDDDWQSFETKMKNLFAVEIDKTGVSTRKMIATYYQDSKGKAVGDARGDGRAVWSGEIALPTTDGKLVYLDVVIKGVDETPLAWTKNASHSGGKQSISEGATSFVVAKANRKNGLDSTGDLMTFIVRDAEGRAVRSITVRVGKQTRMAHPRFHADNPADFKTIMDYIIIRDLGLPLGTEVTRFLVTQYLSELAKNLGEEEARYDDLNAVHGSPTSGNRTSGGSTIDLAPFWYFDGYHADFGYLYGKVHLKNQRGKMLYYLNNVRRMMHEGGYALLPEKAEWARANELYIQTYVNTFTEARLLRMGFTTEQIRRLSTAIRLDAFNILFEISTAQSDQKKLIGGQEIFGAAFDMRRVLGASVKAVSGVSGADEKLNQVFANDRTWASENNSPHLVKLKLDYLNLVSRLLAEIKPENLESVVTRAIQANGTKRYEMGGDFFANSIFFQNQIAPLIESLQADKPDFLENQKRADRAARALVDPLIKPRDKTNLTGRVRKSDALVRFNLGSITKSCLDSLKSIEPKIENIDNPR